MVAKESFDRIIEVIETEVQQRSPEYWEEPVDVKDLCEKAFTEAECDYINFRGRNEIFKFITGMTIPQYINQRIMMRAYFILIHQDKYDIYQLVNVMGVSSESSVYKKFKDFFEMTPKEAFDRKIDHIYSEPYKWEMVSPKGQETFYEAVEVVKGVPVIIRKIDRRAYKVVGLAILSVLFFLGMGIYFYLLLSPWKGDFVCFLNGYGNERGDMISVYQNDTRYKFNLWKRTITVSVNGLSEEYAIDSIKIGEIKCHSITLGNGCEWTASYNKREKSILFAPETVQEKDYKGYAILYFSLYPEELYKQIKGIWDGTYQVYYADASPNSELIDTNTMLDISIDAGCIVLCDEKTLDTKAFSIIFRYPEGLTTYEGVTFVRDLGLTYFAMNIENGQAKSYLVAERINN